MRIVEDHGMVKFFVLIFALSGLSACSLFDISSRERTYDASQELKEYYSERRGEERRYAQRQLGRSPASTEDGQVETRILLNRLEKQISTQSEKSIYYRFKPYLPSDNARIEFLRQPSLDAKTEWLRRRQISTENVEHPPAIQDMINNNDICIGMTRQAVQESWGEADLREIAGNPIYGNERWKYTASKSNESGFIQETRYVFFEGGVVSGWEKY